MSKASRSHSSLQVFFFVISLCFFCALILAVTAFGLESVQQSAKEFDQSKQMLIAAKVLNHAGYFEILQSNGLPTLARWDPESRLLVEDPQADRATEEQIKWIANARIRALLTNIKGEIFTFEEKGISLPDYLSENKKRGYATLPLKLFYAILPNKAEAPEITETDLRDAIWKANIFVIPVSGFGLWAPIYGYIALSSNGNEVVGTTWYEHGETPGLGANITEAWWQKQFFEKRIFLESPGGDTDFRTADMGIIVVKGRVKDVFSSTPKSKSAVDGMSGATLTGDGVTSAYRNSLTPYRAFLTHLHNMKARS